jgi:hypothetical protein
MLTYDRPLYSDKPITDVQGIADLLSDYVVNAKECAFVVCQTEDLTPICVTMVDIGDVAGCVIPARDIIASALMSNAYYVTVVHNHPNAYEDKRNCKPSDADIRGTSVAQKACDLFNIKLADSIILSSSYENGVRKPYYYSIKDHSLYSISGSINRMRNTLNYAKAIHHLEKREYDLDFENSKGNSNGYWGENVITKDMPGSNIYVAHTPEELKMAIDKFSSQVKENIGDKRIHFIQDEKYNTPADKFMNDPDEEMEL